MAVIPIDNTTNVTVAKVNKPSTYKSFTASGLKKTADSFEYKEIISNIKSKHPAGDGKFSFKEAGENFLKGLISPITGMFSSPKNFLISVGAILGTAGLYAIGLGPLVIALWTGYGLVEAGMAAHKIATNKDPDEKEKAFFDIGEATFIVGTSVMCAKSTLKDFGVNTSKMSPFKATVDCFKQTPKSIGKAIGNLKALKNPVKFIKNTFGQLDTTSITDVYGEAVPVKRSFGVKTVKHNFKPHFNTKSGLGVNYNENN
ncbi:MAG: hypothetical protein AB1782_08950 [Cyanobacteriota bacterium]